MAWNWNHIGRRAIHILEHKFVVRYDRNFHVCVFSTTLGRGVKIAG